jgi:hypothetical protein
MSLGQSIEALEANVMPIVGVFTAWIAQADDQLFHWLIPHSRAQEPQPTDHFPPIYFNTFRGSSK